MDSLRSQTILIAEDSAEDFGLIKLALEDNNFKGEIEWFKNGDELIKFLNDPERFSSFNLKKDYIALIDINMPKKNGFETLSAIKTNENLKIIPCILLTTSQASEDIYKAYSLGANSYLTKPYDYLSMVELFKSINAYWFTNNSLPQLN